MERSLYKFIHLFILHLFFQLLDLNSETVGSSFLFLFLLGVAEEQGLRGGMERSLYKFHSLIYSFCIYSFSY